MASPRKTAKTVSRLARASTALAPKRSRAILREMLEGDLLEARGAFARANTYVQFLRTSVAYAWMAVPRSIRLPFWAVAFFSLSLLTSASSWLLSDAVTALALALTWHYFDLRKEWSRRLVALATLHLIAFGATTLIQTLRIIAFDNHLHSAEMERQYAQVSLPFFAAQGVTILVACVIALLAYRKREFGERELHLGFVLAIIGIVLAADLSQAEFALGLTTSQTGLLSPRPLFQGREIRGLYLATTVFASSLVWRGALRIRAIKSKRFAEVATGGQS